MIKLLLYLNMLKERMLQRWKTDYRQAFLSVCKIIMFIMHNTFSVTKGLHTCFYYRWCPCCYCYSYPSLQTKSFKGWYQKEGKMWAETYKSQRRKGERRADLAMVWRKCSIIYTCRVSKKCSIRLFVLLILSGVIDVDFFSQRTPSLRNGNPK